MSNWDGTSRGSRFLDDPAHELVHRVGVILAKTSQLCNQVVYIRSSERGIAGCIPSASRIDRLSQRLDPVESEEVGGRQSIGRQCVAEHSHGVEHHAQLMVVDASVTLPALFERNVADLGGKEELWVEAAQIHRFNPSFSKENADDR
jgi:hypothetical protein